MDKSVDVRVIFDSSYADNVWAVIPGVVVDINEKMVTFMWLCFSVSVVLSGDEQ